MPHNLRLAIPPLLTLFIDQTKPRFLFTITKDFVICLILLINCCCEVICFNCVGALLGTRTYFFDYDCFLSSTFHRCVKLLCAFVTHGALADWSASLLSFKHSAKHLSFIITRRYFAQRRQCLWDLWYCWFLVRRTSWFQSFDVVPGGLIVFTCSLIVPMFWIWYFTEEFLALWERFLRFWIFLFHNFWFTWRLPFCKLTAILLWAVVFFNWVFPWVWASIAVQFTLVNVVDSFFLSSVQTPWWFSLTLLMMWNWRWLPSKQILQLFGFENIFQRIQRVFFIFSLWWEVSGH